MLHSRNAAKTRRRTDRDSDPSRGASGTHLPTGRENHRRLASPSSSSDWILDWNGHGKGRLTRNHKSISSLATPQGRDGHQGGAAFVLIEGEPAKSLGEKQQHLGGEQSNQESVGRDAIPPRSASGGGHVSKGRTLKA